MYTLRFYAYCGMANLPERFDERAEARAAVAESLRRTRRSGRKVVTLTPGSRWEVLEPADAAMVPDWAGTVQLNHSTYACRECGFEHETRQSAASCCQEREEFEDAEDCHAEDIDA